MVDGSTPSTPVMSPNGRWVAYMVTPIGMRETAPGQRALGRRRRWELSPAEADRGNGVQSRSAVGAGFGLALLPADRMERGTAQLHRISLDGGEVEALTTWKGGISDHLPLAEPDLVAVIAPDEPTDEDERRAEQATTRGMGRAGAPLPAAPARPADPPSAPEALGDRHVVEVAERPDGGTLAVLTWDRAERTPAR